MSIADIAGAFAPRYITQCPHGGRLLQSAWYHQPYCVTFGQGPQLNSTLPLTEWGATVTGFYPAESVPDPTPYEPRFSKNPLGVFFFTFFVWVLLTCSMRPGLVYVMAELEKNYVQKKKEYARVHHMDDQQEFVADDGA